MKKFLLIFSIILLTISCSSDDDTNYQYKLLPIKEAFVPDEFNYGQIYTINVKYIRPDDCHIYSDILYEYDYDARNIAVVSTVVDDANCEILDSEEMLSFTVQALQHQPYIFRFWQGDDENGDPIYLEVEVPFVN